MTAPRDCLGTHDGGPLARHQLFHLTHDGFEFGCQRKIRVGAKRTDFPARVLRIGGGFPESTEVAAPDVLNARHVQ